MDRIKTIVSLAAVVCACVAYLAPAAMAETSEFSKVGNQVKASGGETFFTSGETSVVCGSDKGAGKVASIKVLKLEVTYEKCEAFFKGGKSKSVKITPCVFNFSPEDSVALIKGCVIGVKVLEAECVVEPTDSENLKDVLYHAVTNEAGEEAEFETEPRLQSNR
jgi:hypothetical protein